METEYILGRKNLIRNVELTLIAISTHSPSATRAKSGGDKMPAGGEVSWIKLFAKVFCAAIFAAYISGHNYKSTYFLYPYLYE